jgi:DNA-binding IclR family transcriptional regulator
MIVANTIPILEKTVAVVNAIAHSQTGVSAKWLSLSLNIPPATCYRILRTLGKSNWIRSNDDGLYQIAFGLASLASAYSEIEHTLRQLAIPLRALSDATGLSVKVCLREVNDAVTVMRVESSRPNAIASKVGSKMHLAEAGAAGVVLLSGLPQALADSILATASQECWDKSSIDAFRTDIAKARKDGISRALGKYNPSIFAIAVPLKFAPDNTAALAVVGWPEDFEGSKKATVEKLLKQHTQVIQKLIHRCETQG